MASHAAKISNSPRLQQTLATLRDGQWHTGAEITAITESQALHTDIHELRENGYSILQRYRPGLSKTGRRISEYQLAVMAVAA